jgi:hypothetical protein
MIRYLEGSFQQWIPPAARATFATKLLAASVPHSLGFGII